MKTLTCKDIGMDCPWVGRAETIDELVKIFKEHLMEAHKEKWDKEMKNMSDKEIQKMIKPHVRDE